MKGNRRHLQIAPRPSVVQATWSTGGLWPWPSCVCEGHFVLTHLLLDELKKSAAEEDGDARVVVVTSSLHDMEQSKKRGRELMIQLKHVQDR